MGKEILEGCKILLHTCGAVKENEKVLVVTDETSRQIGEAMYQCAVEYTDATLICTKDRTTPWGSSDRLCGGGYGPGRCDIFSDDFLIVQHRRENQSL